MNKKLLWVLMVVFVGLALAAPMAFAEPIEGEVIVAEGGTYTLKDYNGKEYQITEDLVTGLKLKKGDIVQFELQEAKPVNVKKIAGE